MDNSVFYIYNIFNRPRKDKKYFEVREVPTLELKCVVLVYDNYVVQSEQYSMLDLDKLYENYDVSNKTLAIVCDKSIAELLSSYKFIGNLSLDDMNVKTFALIQFIDTCLNAFKIFLRNMFSINQSFDVDGFGYRMIGKDVNNVFSARTFIFEFKNSDSNARFLTVSNPDSMSEVRINDIKHKVEKRNLYRYRMLVDFYYSEGLNAYVLVFSDIKLVVDLDGEVYTNSFNSPLVYDCIEKCTKLVTREWCFINKVMG